MEKVVGENGRKEVKGTGRVREGGTPVPLLQSPHGVSAVLWRDGETSPLRCAY